MSYKKIGTCSICGGDVMGFEGPYFGDPPPAQCNRCGAVRRTERKTPDKDYPVIPMVPRRDPYSPWDDFPKRPDPRPIPPYPREPRDFPNWRRIIDRPYWGYGNYN